MNGNTTAKGPQPADYPVVPTVEEASPGAQSEHLGSQRCKGPRGMTPELTPRPECLTARPVSMSVPTDSTYGLPPVLCVEEAARFLSVNIKTVRDAISAGDFPARRVGRRVVILRDALLHWLWSDNRVLPAKQKRSR